MGALATWEGQTLNVPLSFLGKGTFEIEIFQDGVNAGREATDYKRITKSSDRGRCAQGCDGFRRRMGRKDQQQIKVVCRRVWLMVIYYRL
ncbi:glycoside hydrolase family 97 C-terminal domain-containing protein [Chryseolinea sp. Jin1]|uniref:Glycoside hydrolase family 97 C-terminal domain-containing protein n=1 Tax=Chryseolinea lacunae TaxID=2801331 RepID=A0ABS1KME2_9BACT|nr:glycoside hydrolase family 97 C-terminal domain-containing protein [Chryseolinea lacunae]